MFRLDILIEATIAGFAVFVGVLLLATKQ